MHSPTTKTLSALLLISAIVMAVLNLTGVTAFSWWLVLAPLWVPWAMMIMIMIALGVMWCFAALADLFGIGDKP